MRNQERDLLGIFVLLLITFILSACTSSEPLQYLRGDQGPAGPTTPILTAPATLLQCPTGGTVVSMGTQHAILCNGSIGAQGPSGVDGATGATGAQGPQGVSGADGANGTNGQDGAAGANGVDGQNGSNGTNGQDGATGSQGPQGPAGASGANGIDTTPITVVNLCPGTSNYGVFVEIALCLNNNLYAVYSANGGFLTYLAPGGYSSNAIGSACSLTVQPNCVVTH